jgi:hypothetical protein
MYFRGHGPVGVRGSKAALDPMAFGILVFQLARPDFWVSNSLGMAFFPRYTGTSAARPDPCQQGVIL